MQPSRNATRFAFIMITSLFFMWGFVHNLDPILIPHLKKSFSLSTVQSSLVDFAVYIAYFAMAIPAGMIIRKYGYKTGIVLGLFLFAGGSFLFIPAANTQQYAFFLAALFIIACGLAMLETVANPYASLLGDPAKATQRLNFAQSFNGLAVTLSPLIGIKLILTKGNSDEALLAMDAVARKAALAAEASSVKLPYFVLGCILLVIAIIFICIRLPEIKEKDNATHGKNIFHVLKHKHLSAAVAAQFFYVGAQVCVGSFFILFLKEAAGITNNDRLIIFGTAYGLAFMLGRFAGTLFMQFIAPPKLLTIYAVISAVLCITVMTTNGMFTIYTLIAIAFFMSIMFPTIFALGIKDLGADTELGSSLLIMSIVGGALLPLIFARITDTTNNIQLSYVVPMVCFVVVAWFGWKGHVVKEVKHS